MMIIVKKTNETYDGIDQIEKWEVLEEAQAWKLGLNDDIDIVLKRRNDAVFVAFCPPWFNRKELKSTDLKEAKIEAVEVLRSALDAAFQKLLDLGSKLPKKA